jgi:restriction system protein
MSIWIYDNNVRDTRAVSAAINAKQCVYCNSLLEIPRSTKSTESHIYASGTFSILVRCCPVCGWWTKREEHLIYTPGFGPTPSEGEVIYGAAGSLRELDLKDQSIPIEEIRAYLAAKYDTRFNIDPWKFEETVASIYRDFGYEARVTARSGDDGIDVILDGPDDSVIGVQVKRYKGKINVEQIRSLAGALLLNGLTRGIFITTSSFQSGANSTAERFRLIGIPIELVDAEGFYDALGLAQRTAYMSISDPTAPFFDAPTIKISELYIPM